MPIHTPTDVAQSAKFITMLRILGVDDVARWRARLAEALIGS